MKKFKKNPVEEVQTPEVVDAEFEEVNEEETEKKGFKIPKPVLIAGGVAAGLLAIFGISKIGGGSDVDLYDLDPLDEDENAEVVTWDGTESSEESEASTEDAEK